MGNVQCSGITVKGSRCKLLVSQEVRYCHYHTKQASQGQVKRELVKPEPQKGFIYVYTLKHLASPSPQRQDWLQIKKRAKTEGKETKWEVFNPKRHILIKIGLTTGTVDNRLKQWEAKCNHSLTFLDPYVNHEHKSLISLLKNLKVKSKNYLTHYDEEGHGFYTTKKLAKIERTIHERLWKVYGRGDMVCHGCSHARGYGIHLEWFMLERKELKRCFQQIDEVCELFK